MGGIRGTDPLILNLNTRVSGQLQALPALPQDPLHMRLDESQSQSGSTREKTNLLSLPGIEPRFFGRPPHSLITTLTELSVPIIYDILYFIGYYSCKCLIYIYLPICSSMNNAASNSDCTLPMKYYTALCIPL
jgi:hypothetical protein